MSNRGKPSIATSNDDRCEALSIMTAWKRSKKVEERCPFMARYAMQGRQFCMHHARVEAMAICYEKGFLKRIVAPVPVVGARVRVAKSTTKAKP